MNGAQDLGGQHGFGPIEHDEPEPVFHHEWEKRAFAITLACGFLGQWNIDQGRYARESLPPAKYLSSSYYEIWTEGLIKLLLDRGMVVPGEVQLGKQEVAPRDLGKKALPPDQVAATLARGGPANRDIDTAPAFKPGDAVSAVRMNPTTHTRLPRYLRGCSGEVVLHHGAHVLPDASAHGKGDNPEHLYTVRFSAREVWGEKANPNDFVHADLWESYLAAS